MMTDTSHTNGGGVETSVSGEMRSDEERSTGDPTTEVHQQQQERSTSRQESPRTAFQERSDKDTIAANDEPARSQEEGRSRGDSPTAGYLADQNTELAKSSAVPDFKDDEPLVVDQELIDRVRGLAQGQLCFAIVQILFSTAILILTALNKEGNNPVDFRPVLAATVSLFGSFIGLVGALWQLELISRIYFVVQLWMFSTVTTYLYIAQTEESSRSSICNPRAGSFAAADTESAQRFSCSTKLAFAKLKFALGFLSLFNSFITSLISMNYVDALDALNDEKVLVKFKQMQIEDERRFREVTEFRPERDGPNESRSAAYLDQGEEQEEEEVTKTK